VNYTPIQPARLYEQIVQQIEGNILRGDLKPGDKLPSERELADQFGVSRTAVREAVKALIQMGLIDAQPGRGTFVIQRSPSGVRDVMANILKTDLDRGTRGLVEVREILEPEIAALAAQRAGEENLAAMQAAIAQMDQNLDDIDAFIEADLDFHLALAESSHNPLILALIDNLVDILRSSRRRIALVPGGIRRAQEHHKRIYAAVEHGDPVAARQAMSSHMIQVRSDSETSLKQAP
jgi:GntR family transcriptional repressor for pyruvate dehydrogenase complex